MGKPDFKQPQSYKPDPAKPAADRRNFLVRVAAVAAGAIAALVPLVAGLVMALDPLRRTAKPPQMRLVARLVDVPENGQPLAVRILDDRVDAFNLVKNQPIGLVYVRRVGDGTKVETLTAECPHAGCNVSFAEGSEGAAGVYKCPCHNSTFKVDGEIIQPSPSPRAMDKLVCKVLKPEGGEDEVWVEFQRFHPGIAEPTPKD
jgi:menaquinol-cytochrome c reductase iron-sulfur subunit